jgi:hypothetical protein
LGLVLLFSLPSLKLVPFYDKHGYPFATDFHNLHAFHNCEAKNAPYLVPGPSCNDGNDQVYPPLLYWSYVWTRAVDYFPTGTFIWVGALIAMMTGSAVFWLRGATPVFWLWPLFLLQYPMFFAMERANNDAIVVVTWTLLSYFWLRSRYFWAGFFGGLSVALKIYPVFAVLLLGLALVVTACAVKRIDQRLWLAAGGSALGFLSNFILFPNQAWVYFTQVLPKWSNHSQGMHISVHGVFSIYHPIKAIGAAFGLLLAITWAWRIRKLLEKDPEIALAGALAISTFFPRTSNDYNLVTAYPLFLILAARFYKTGRRELFWVFASGCFTVLGYRYIFEHVAGYHIALQVVWLMGVAIFFSSRGSQPVRSRSGS